MFIQAPGAAEHPSLRRDARKSEGSLPAPPRTELVHAHTSSFTPWAPRNLEWVLVVPGEARAVAMLGASDLSPLLTPCLCFLPAGTRCR